MDFCAISLAAPGGCGDDSSNHSASETCMLPAYLRAPEVNSQVMAEYIWLAAGGQLRSKTRVLESKPSDASQAPIMVVESNPGGQLAEPNYEIFLKPRKIFRDPFRGGDHILILCDTFFAAQVAAEGTSLPATVLQPTESNSRVACENVLKVAEEEEPIFAAEQEYAIIHPAYPTVVPLGPRRASSRSCGSSNGNRHSHSSGAARGVSKACHGGKGATAHAATPAGGSPAGTHPSPVSSKEQSSFRQKSARTLADSHLRCCLFAGVKVTGADVHSLEGLHSYKIGPSRGIDLCDDLWTSRYLLQRVAEDQGKAVSWQPDALPSERPLGCYFKYSTAGTRQAPQGLGAIGQQLARLQATHLHHLYAYNDGRLERLAAAGPEASSFTHAVGSAAASVVVPSLTYMQQGGYYTDRRPPSDADPYKVTLMLAATTLDIPLPQLPPAAPSSGGCGGFAVAPSGMPHMAPDAMAAAAVPPDMAYSPMSSFLLAVRQQQIRHCMYDTESEEFDSVDEDACMTDDDSAALLAKMDREDGGAGAGGSSCESGGGIEEEDDASSGPVDVMGLGDVVFGGGVAIGNGFGFVNGINGFAQMHGLSVGL